MCPVFGDTIYEYFIAGLDTEYKDLYPSILATWAPIEYAARNDLRFFDFMGAGKPDEDYGVREFKSKFGGKQVNYGRYQKIYNRILYSSGNFGLKILKKISA
jgi:serine/alanine adding enzyme